MPMWLGNDGLIFMALNNLPMRLDWVRVSWENVWNQKMNSVSDKFYFVESKENTGITS